MKFIFAIIASIITLSVQAQAESLRFHCTNEGHSSIAFTVSLSSTTAAIQMNNSDFGGSARSLKGRSFSVQYFETFNTYSNYRSFIAIDPTRSLTQLVQLRFRNADLNNGTVRMLLETAAPSTDQSAEGVGLTFYGMLCKRS